MGELTYIPGLAISRAITADELLLIESAPYIPVSGGGVSFPAKANSLEKSPYGVNSFTHAVVTWEDKLQRTLLGFDPYGLVPQTQKGAKLPDNVTVKQALTRLAGHVMRTMAYNEIIVIAEPIELRDTA